MMMKHINILLHSKQLASTAHDTMNISAGQSCSQDFSMAEQQSFVHV